MEKDLKKIIGNIKNWTPEEREARWEQFKKDNPTVVPAMRKDGVVSKIKAWLGTGANKWYAIGGVLAVFLMFAMFGG